MQVAVIIPALNEEQSLGCVLADIPSELQPDIVVVDNGSTDRTAEVARAYGARVVWEPKRGYGQACRTGMAALGQPDVVVFLDADYSDYPEEMTQLVEPIWEQRADLVIGSRLRGRRERGALPPHSLFGNWLASTLLRLLYGQRVTDLGPFRAIRYDRLQALEMSDQAFGWTVEMQAKAAQRGYRVVEVPVRYRPRLGQSKITGTLRNSIRAGLTILYTLFRLAWSERSGPSALPPVE